MGSSNIVNLIANYNPSGFATANQKAEADLATAKTQAPYNQQLTQEISLKNQVEQRQLDGQKALQDYYARLHSQSQDASPPVSPPVAAQAAAPNVPIAATPNVQGIPAPVGAVAPGAAPATATQAAPRAMGPSAAQGNPNAFFSDLTSNGVPPEMALKHVNSLMKYNQELAGLDTTQLDNKVKRLSMAGDAVGGYIQNPTPEGYAQARAEVMKTDPEHASLLPDPATNPLPSEAQLATFLGATGEVKKIAELRKEKQATQTSAAQQTEAAANTQKTNVEAGIQQIKLDGMKGNTQQLSASIDQIIDPAKYPAQNLRAKGMANFALQRGDDPSVAVRSVADEIGDIDKKLNPAVRNAAIEDDTRKAAAVAPIEIKKATAIAAATEPIHVQEQVDAEIAKMKLSPDALAGVNDPRARSSASTNYEKDSKDYADKVSAGDQLNQFVDAAQSGNKAAPGLIPLSELRTMVSRVNRTELQSAGANAGSIFDRLQGKLGGLSEGQPIPPEVLKDIKAIGEMQTKAARTNYENKVKITNETTGAKFKPIDLNKSASQTIRARDPQGTLHEAPAGTPLPAGWKAE